MIAMHVVEITIETFGMARMISRQSKFVLNVQNTLSLKEFCGMIADECPSLLRGVIRKDFLGLEDSYVFNLNGELFLNSDELDFHEGDKILIFSSQAGG